MIDLASLVLAPTAVKDGKVYNAIPNDQDFTFSRGTEATRVNSAGLIEKARTNFLLQSNTFDTTWTNARLSSLTSGQSGYDGSNDAWSVVPNTANDDHKIYQSVSQTGVITFSVYAKANGYNGLALVSSNTNNGKFFNLSNGTLGNDFNSSPIDSTITEIGNGWYRCEVVFNVSAGNFFTIYVSSDGTSTYSFSGNETDGILIQSAQLEQGLTATDVITTTTTSVTVGITDDLPRVDYSGGGCPSLLLEPSRTNLIDNTEYFGGYSFFGNASLTTNYGISPEGKQNGSRITGLDGAGTNDLRKQLSFNCANKTLSFSVYLKGSGTLRQQISNGVDQAHTQIITLTSEWKRHTVTGTFNSTSVSVTYLVLDDSGVTATEYEIWGTQFEEGSYATSYIPSYGTSTSRSADSCSLTNASNLIGQSEGTFYWEGSFQNSINPILLQLIPSGGNYTNSIYLEYTGGNIRISSWYSGTLQAQISVSASLNTNYKVAFAYKENDFVAYVNGTSIGSDTSGSIPDGLSRVFIGQLNSTTAESFVGCKPKQTILFPTRLTNDQLAELTK